MNSTMLKITYTENGLSLLTVPEEFYLPRRFFISSNSIKVLSEKKKELVRDGYSSGILELISGSVYHQEMKITLLELAEKKYGYSGLLETFIIPYDELLRLLSSRDEQGLTYTQESKRLMIEFVDGYYLPNVVENNYLLEKLIRCIESKFLMRAYRSVEFSNFSEPYSFGFEGTTRYGSKLTGGLILNGSEDFRTAYYSSHT